MISVVFLIELIVVAVSAYPLFSIKGNIGIVIWLFLFAITLYTASKIEKKMWMLKIENTSEYNKITDWRVSKNLIEQRGIYNEF